MTGISPVVIVGLITALIISKIKKSSMRRIRTAAVFLWPGDGGEDTGSSWVKWPPLIDEENKTFSCWSFLRIVFVRLDLRSPTQLLLLQSYIVN